MFTNNARIKIVFDKEVAFSGYLRNILNMKRWPWIRRGPLKEVPKDLIEKAIKFSEPVRFSFERHPLKDFGGFSEGFEKILKESEKLHNRAWKKYQKELKAIYKTLRELIKKYGIFLIKSIPEITKRKWFSKEIWLIPSIYSGGTVVNNKIFFGFSLERSKERNLAVLLHEMIHVNTSYVREKNWKKLRFPSDSNEIVTVLLTNKVIDKLNKKFKLKIKPQRFFAKQKLKEYISELHSIGEHKKSYRTLIYAIDQFLVKKGYQGYYDKYLK